MKKLILSIAVIMMVMLLIGTYIYEKQNQKKIIEEPPPPEIVVEEQPVQLQAVTDDIVSYTLQEDTLHITFDKGENWLETPIDKASLFQGEYTGNEMELIDGSYVLTEEFAAFMYAEDTEQDFIQQISLKYSLDQGSSWHDSVIIDKFSPMRFRKVDFLDDNFGYVILSGGRTMSQEYSTVFLTTDGGKTWEATTDPPTTRLIGFGNFVDEQTGFLSYGTINPEEPEMYVTEDTGQTWKEAQFHIPEQYHLVFVQAEEPVKEGDFLSVLVNQGPNGDYLGGKVKGKFVSEDNGFTWEFQKEVEPDETSYE